MKILNKNKPSILLCGIDIKNNPFKVLGEIIFEVDREITDTCTIIKSDFPFFYKEGCRVWHINDLFYDMNGKVYYSGNANVNKSEFSVICFCNGYPVYSKHTIDKNHIRVLLYDPLAKENKIIRQKIENDEILRGKVILEI